MPSERSTRPRVPFPGAVTLPLAPARFGTPGYGSPHFTALYSSGPFPEGKPSPPCLSLLWLGHHPAPPEAGRAGAGVSS